ncbi:MAG TPA: hypothetical protein VK993_13465 [Chthoniobacterales bacterium]|nr:hypothetical protein [Chthoniobacterales bacterium]
MARGAAARHKAGGYLLATTHGSKHIEKLPEELRRDAFEKRFCYVQVGNTEGLPDFYQVACHTPEYIRRQWSEFFDVVEVQERALDDSQDIVVCRAT